MTAGIIGDGRLLRVCDLCGKVDDHPRHVLAGNTGDDVFAAPTPALIRAVMDATSQLKMAPEDADRVLTDLVDTTASDRHVDCCAGAGCPNGICDVQLRDAPNRTGRAMMDFLIDQPDPFADIDDVVRGLTEEQVRAGRPITSKMLRQNLNTLLFALMLATRGLSAVNFAQAFLNVVSGTTFTGAAGSFIQLHTGDPGASGTTAVSSVTTRPSATWNAATGTGPATKTISNTPSWTSWAGTSPETVTDVSDWSASSAGTFYFSVQLTASKSVQTGDTLTLNSLSLSATPIAA